MRITQASYPCPKKKGVNSFAIAAIPQQMAAETRLIDRIEVLNRVSNSSFRFAPARADIRGNRTVTTPVNKPIGIFITLSAL